MESLIGFGSNRFTIYQVSKLYHHLSECNTEIAI